MIKLKQGSSLGMDITSPQAPDLTGDWAGKWAIVKVLGVHTVDNTVASGNLTKSNDNTKFELRVPPTATEDVPVGKYFLIVQCESASLSFKDEPIQEVLDLLPQGIKG